MSSSAVEGTKQSMEVETPSSASAAAGADPASAADTPSITEQVVDDAKDNVSEESTEVGAAANNDGGTDKETVNNTNTSNNNDRSADFDHTSRKVVVHNVLKYIRAKEISKLTSTWLKDHDQTAQPIKIVKTKKPPKDNWIKVTLEDESMVNPFIEVINTGGVDGKAMLNQKGKPMFAKRADEMFQNNNGGRDNNNDKKRKDRDNNINSNGGHVDGRPQNKRFKPEVRILSTDEVRDAITPLWRLPYEEQLDTKAREMVNKCAKKIVKEIKGKFRVLERETKRGQRKGTIKLYDWVSERNAIHMEQPVPSPLQYEYRNKCEFTFGYRLLPDETKKDKVEDDWVMVKQEGRENTEKEAKMNEEADVKVEVEAAEADAKSNTAKEEVETGDEAAEETKAMGEDAVDVKEKTKGGGSDNAAKAEGVNAKEEDSKEVSDTPPAATFQKVPATGFLAQGWSGGVYSPHCLQNMPDWSCGIADIINNQFLPSSPLPPYDTKVHRGVWRTVTIRCSLRTKECMVIILHAPAKGGAGAKEDGSDDCTEAFESEKKRLVELLTQCVIPTPKRDYPEGHVAEEKKEDEEGIRVTSIFFQEFEGLSHPTPDHPVQHVFGKKSIEENLGKCSFQISPGAFFQTNTQGAEVLYDIVVQRIKEVTPDPQQTLLLDVCCGTGTIGLTCLKEGVVGRLVGVDIAAPAIADAKINAKKNDYTDSATTQFIASAAEKVLPETMKDLPRDKPIVAVVDPARDGLHGIVVRTLRANSKIQRLVYVSCNPTGTLVRDAAMLCSPPTKKYPGRPFKPVKSQPVDMFPLTKHCEMVMTFDRMSKDEYEKYHGVEEK